MHPIHVSSFAASMLQYDIRQQLWYAHHSYELFRNNWNRKYTNEWIVKQEFTIKYTVQELSSSIKLLI